MIFSQLGVEKALPFGYTPAHQLRLDSYMAQHPGDGSDRRDRQSVLVHLVSLCALLESKRRPERADYIRALVVDHFPDPPHLTRSSGPGELTVLYLLDAGDRSDYEKRARAWGQAVWESWAEQHSLIHDALATVIRR